jgi:endonuclease/exonuclease/phosphatase family metal-dependent hydrolase
MDSDPTTTEIKTSDGVGVGSFSSIVSGLQPSALYFLRVFATNGQGTAYGSGVSFETQSASETIHIASFNLQVFGPTKAAKAPLLAVYASIFRHFDVIAVQEIRDASGTALPALMNAVNSDGSRYDVISGPRLGSTSSKEQYAYIFNTTTIQELPGSYTFNGSAKTGVDEFERDPLVAKFKARTGDFDFVLVDVHTKPEAATAEIGHLPDVIADAVATLGEEDVICLGDYNADGSYFDESTYQTYFPSSEYDWLIQNSVDTSVASASNTYDRMVTTKSVDEDFDGTAGVYRYDQVGDLGSSGLTTADVSDHYPISAEFWVGKDTD